MALCAFAVPWDKHDKSPAICFSTLAYSTRDVFIIYSFIFAFFATTVFDVASLLRTRSHYLRRYCVYISQGEGRMPRKQMPGDLFCECGGCEWERLIILLSLHFIAKVPQQNFLKLFFIIAFSLTDSH